MQPRCCVMLSWVEEIQITNQEDVASLCARLTEIPVFWVYVSSEEKNGRRTLDVIVESGRALVSFLDLDRGIKLASQNDACYQRGTTSLRNDGYPDLQLDQIEVHYRDLISPEPAIRILRHYLLTGEPIDLVNWPPDDW